MPGLSDFLAQTFLRHNVRPEVQTLITNEYQSGLLHDLFATQSGLSAHIDGAQAVFYSGSNNFGGATLNNYRVAQDYVAFQNGAAGHVATYLISDTERGAYIAEQTRQGSGGLGDRAISEINQALRQAGLRELSSDEKAAVSEPAWRSASEAMAHEAVGDVRAFVSETSRGGLNEHSTFELWRLGS